MLSFFPWDVFDEILSLIGSVSEGFPTYFAMFYQQKYMIVLEMADNLGASVLLVLRVFRAP